MDGEQLSFCDYEHIIIDGASNDMTVELANKYAAAQSEQGISVKVISESDEGIYDAMNKGLALANGVYAGFLNADDRYAPHTFAHVAELAHNTEADCIGGACEIVRDKTPMRVHEPLPDMLEAAFPQEMPVNHQSLFVRTETLRDIGGFRTQFPIAADYDLCLRLIKESHGEDKGALNWALTDTIFSYFALGGASYHPVRTARDYRAVRLANGWPWLLAQSLYVRNLVASSTKRLFTIERKVLWNHHS